MELDLEKVLKTTLASYRGALLAVGEAGAQACPPAAQSLKEKLRSLTERLTLKPSTTLVVETEAQVKQELQAWGQTAAHFYQEKTDDMKELMLLVAKAASEVGDRDQRYADQFGDLAARLQIAAGLNNLTAMRHSLSKHASELRVCATKMAKDGKDSIAALRSQLTAYETRLAEVERIASVDPLTALANRRKLEEQIELRVKRGQPFSVVYLDINDFKKVNDTLGHLHGDDLLKQFAGELRIAFRSIDLIGRWGGDEFLILVDGEFEEAESRYERIEQWVAGEYTLSADGKEHKLAVTVAIGIATFEPGDTRESLLHRADSAMYQNKAGLPRR